MIRFEINSGQHERATKFYSDVFCWEIQKWDGSMEYYLIHTGEGPGFDGGLARRTNPSAITINTIDGWFASFQNT